MTYILKSESELRAETITVQGRRGKSVKKPGTYLLDILHQIWKNGFQKQPITFQNRVPIVKKYPNCFRTLSEAEGEKK